MKHLPIKFLSCLTQQGDTYTETEKPTTILLFFKTYLIKQQLKVTYYIYQNKQIYQAKEYFEGISTKQDPQKPCWCCRKSSLITEKNQNTPTNNGVPKNIMNTITFVAYLIQEDKYYYKTTTPTGILLLQPLKHLAEYYIYQNDQIHQAQERPRGFPKIHIYFIKSSLITEKTKTHQQIMEYLKTL